MKILCATNLLPNSESAPERAAILARNKEAHLVLIHVLAEAEPHHLLEEERPWVGTEDIPERSREHTARNARLRSAHRAAPQGVLSPAAHGQGSRHEALVEAAA